MSCCELRDTPISQLSALMTHPVNARELIQTIFTMPDDSQSRPDRTAFHKSKGSLSYFEPTPQCCARGQEHASVRRFVYTLRKASAGAVGSET